MSCNQRGWIVRIGNLYYPSMLEDIGERLIVYWFGIQSMINRYEMSLNVMNIIKLNKYDNLNDVF